MPRFFRTVTKKFLIIANLVFAAFFLAACANAFLHPAEWWMLAILGFAFPFFLVFNLFFFLFWLLLRSRWALLSLFVLVLGYSNIRALIGMNYNEPPFRVQKADSTIRVLSWNVLSFDEQTRDYKRSTTFRKEMFAFIKEQDPDVLCFQEYLEPNTKKFYSNVKDLELLGYPYHYTVGDYARPNNTFQVGVAIFSKYPMVDSFRIQYPGPKSLRAAESLIHADIKAYGKRIRIYTTHLQSILFKKQDYRSFEIIKNAEDSMVEASKSLVKKFRQGYTFRGDQVEIVRRELDGSPYPEIICGDFNDIPNSYTYFTVKGDRKDAFIEKGSGISRTFQNLSPTLRIDFIMVDKRFEVTQFKRFQLPYSDHFPIIADLKITKEIN